jgi:acyl carrier protein
VTTTEFSIPALMDVLVKQAGLPATARTDDAALTFTDVGLDSLAFLQLQTELMTRFGFELPDLASGAYTFGEIVTLVNSRLAEGVAK